ncbi:MAG: hypothetical protein WBM57_13500 [Woeseiaceae bacterium]|jgi:hypothetical protein
MFFKARAKNDAFAFALGGAGMVGAFAPVPVIPNDRINKAWDERLAKAKRTGSVPSNRAPNTVLAAECS